MHSIATPGERIIETLGADAFVGLDARFETLGGFELCGPSPQELLFGLKQQPKVERLGKTLGTQAA